MKRLILICCMVAIVHNFSLATSTCANSCSCPHASQTFFSVRPPFQESSPELVSTFNYERFHARKNGIDGALQLVRFGGRSTNPTALAKYFMPFCQPFVNATLAHEEFPVNTVFAQHFNIFTQTGTFASTVSFKPHQTYEGAGFSYRQDFLANKDRTGFLFASVSFPVLHVSNDMELCERITDSGGGANPDENTTVVANMTQAFAQSDWNFGKIACTQSHTGVADVQVKLGYEWLHQLCHVELYLGATLPTGNKPTGKFVFEAIVGNNRHGGVMWGSASGFNLWQDNDTSVHVEWALNTQYLFSNTQTRSFDLKYKPWSRYMETYASLADAQAAQAQTNPLLAANQSTPGINVFTKPLSVTPGFIFDMNASFVILNAHGFDGELGYNLYAKDQECVALDCGWQEGPALKALLGAGTTQPLRDITGNEDLDEQLTPVALADYSDSIITLDDLDLNSAAHPAFISHTVYATFGYRWDKKEYPRFASVGASYEFSTVSNAVLDRWMIWGKCGVSF